MRRPDPKIYIAKKKPHLIKDLEGDRWVIWDWEQGRTFVEFKVADGGRGGPWITTVSQNKPVIAQFLQSSKSRSIMNQSVLSFESFDIYSNGSINFKSKYANSHLK